MSAEQLIKTVKLQQNCRLELLKGFDVGACGKELQNQVPDHGLDLVKLIQIGDGRIVTFAAPNPAGILSDIGQMSVDVIVLACLAVFAQMRDEQLNRVGENVV